jgi:hypothetical protein
MKIKIRYHNGQMRLQLIGRNQVRDNANKPVSYPNIR